MLPKAHGPSSTALDFVQSPSVSKDCPISVQFQYFQKLKTLTLSTLFSSPKYVKKLSREEKCNIFNLIGQSFDNLWISISNLCPGVFKLDLALT